jgi:hypothetical protein
VGVIEGACWACSAMPRASRLECSSEWAPSCPSCASA